MSDTLANDIIVRENQMRSDRSGFEVIWREIAEHCDPLSGFNLSGSAANQTDTTRLSKIFNSRPGLALERSGSAAISLLVPSGDLWHGLKPIDEDLVDNKAVKEYCAVMRKRLFSWRYDPKAGFQAAIGPAFREMMAYGIPCLHVEEQFGGDAPFLYRHIPLEQVVYSVDSTGAEDTVFRKFPMTAKQMAEKFGEGKLAEPVKRVLDDPKLRGENHFNIIHAVYPAISGRASFRFDDVYVDVDNKKILRERGQFEMPYLFSSFGRVDSRLPYGYSPGMRALPDIKGAHLAKQLFLRSAQKNIDPVIGVSEDYQGIIKSLNAGSMVRGAFNKQGQQVVAPLNLGGNPNLGNDVFEMYTNDIDASFAMDLFVVYLNKPDTTATEAMLRAQERSDLLSPLFEQQEAMLGRMIAREISILNRKAENGEIDLPPMPDELQQAGGIDLEFTSPLAQLRKSKQAGNTLQAINSVGQLAQLDPGVLDTVDFDEAAFEIGNAFGASPSIWRDAEGVAAIRQARAQQQQQQQAQMAQQQQVDQVAQLTPALKMMSEGGGVQ